MNKLFNIINLLESNFSELVFECIVLSNYNDSSADIDNCLWPISLKGH